MRKLIPNWSRRPLLVEWLEDRDCPNAAPVVASLSVLELSDSLVRVSGQVLDEDPASATVAISGMANGSINPDFDGTFTADVTGLGVGTISVVATDVQGLDSTAAQVNFASNVPTISDLSFSWSTTNPTSVTVTGTVSDEFPAGSTVNFSGAATGSTYVNSDGTFSAELTADYIGAIDVEALDQWYQSSDAASITLTNNAPVIVQFESELLANGNYRFYGVIDDEHAEGLTVMLTGVVDLQVTVGADGMWSIEVDLDPGTSGIESAMVTDWWGEISEEALDYVSVA